MSLLVTGVGKVTGVATSTNNGLMRWDGTTGELAQDSIWKLTDAGNLKADSGSIEVTSPSGDHTFLFNDTGAFYDGVELGTGGQGSGDVVGPLNSVDYRVPTFDGATGKLLRQSLVSIGPTGDCLGMTSLAVDNIFINGQIVEAAINTDLVLQSTGTGRVHVNGVTVDVNQNMDTSGDITMYDGDLLLSGGDATIEEGALYFHTLTGGYTISHKSDNEGKSIQEYRNKLGVRVGWFGFGSSGDTDWTMRNEQVNGDIEMMPQNADGTGSLKVWGYTQMGANHGAPKIKMKKLTTTMPAQGDSVSVSHGLTGIKILGVTVLCASSGNYGIPPDYRWNAGFQYDFYQHSSNIVIINTNNGANVVGDPVRILITYEE